MEGATSNQNQPMKSKNYYLCNCCSGITQRDSSKNKIESYCEETGKDATLTIIKSDIELSKKLRRKFLKNIIELSSFTKKERHFLEICFERGVQITFNRIKS